MMGIREQPGAGGTAREAATAAQLADDLRRLGVEAGDVLFIHSSLRSVGPLQDGAATLIEALEAAVGPQGLVLMPSFNLVEAERRAETWDHATTSATTGYLCEYFRLMPGTVRSDHYSHSVAARGRGAADIVGGHREQVGMVSPWDLEPWGRTYGSHSPMLRALDLGTKILMLGVDYRTSTYLHVVEVMLWNRRLAASSQSSFNYVNREALGTLWDSMGRVSRGKVGQSDCRLFTARDYVDTMLATVLEEPQTWCKWWND